MSRKRTPDIQTQSGEPLVVDGEKPSIRKIVINGCYGGFGLSPEALLQLIKMDSELITKQLKEKYYGTRQPPQFSKFKEGFSVEDFTQILSKREFVYYLSFSVERDHPDLVAIVEKLGKKANGKCADLKIVSIPSDVKWEIEEYDGNEWVAEQHRIWS